MAKIGVFIQSSNQELFRNNTKVLKEFYHKVIQQHNFDIEVYSFTGDEQASCVYEDGDTIYCNCNDRNVYEKHKQIFKYIKDNKRYDKILFVNNSTLVNLENLYYYCDNIFNVDYCCLNTAIRQFTYPNGNFKLMNFDTFLAIQSMFEDVYELVRPLYEFLYSDKDVLEKINANKNQWIGIPEDVIIGMCLYRLGIVYNTISDDNHIAIDNYFDYRVGSIYEWPNMVAVTFKIPWSVYYEDEEYSPEANFKFRLENETNLLKSLINDIENMK